MPRPFCWVFDRPPFFECTSLGGHLSSAPQSDRDPCVARPRTPPDVEVTALTLTPRNTGAPPSPNLLTGSDRTAFRGMVREPKVNPSSSRYCPRHSLLFPFPPAGTPSERTCA